MEILDLLLLKKAKNYKLVEDTVTGNPVAFNTNVVKPLNSVVVPLTYSQEGTGDPSPTNIRTISGANSFYCMHTKKNMATIRGYSAETKYYNDAGTLSNKYGTTISTTSPESSLDITQSSSTTDYAKSNYRNGYVIFRTDNMVPGQRYDVSIKVTNITSNPLETALSELGLTSPSGGFSGTSEVIGNVVIWKNMLYTDASDRQAWEFRNCGMSCTVSEFMVTPANTTDGVYEAYDGAKLDVAFPALGKNLCDAVSGNDVVFNDGSSTKYNNYSISSGTVTTTGRAFFGFKVKCKPSTQYTFSYTATGSPKMRVAAFETEPSVLDNSSNYIVTSDLTTRAFTTGENTQWITCGCYVPQDSAGATMSNFQLEEGGSASAYEPYNNSVYSGSLDLISGTLTLTHQILSTTWGAGVSAKEFTTNERRRFEFPISCVGAGSAGNNTISNIAPYLWEYSEDSVHFYNNNLYSYMFLPIGTSDSTEIQIVGKLAEPITIQLNPHSITAIKGTNTVWTNTTGNISLTYLKKS